MNKKKALSFVLIFALALQILVMPFADAAAAATKTAAAAETIKTVKNGLQKTGKKLYFYKNGKKLTNVWRTVGGYTYYFGKNGAAYTGRKKIKGSWYYFDKNCRMAQDKSVKAGGGKYYFMADGKAAKRAVRLKNGQIWKVNSAGKLVKNISKYAKENASYDAFEKAAGKALNSQVTPGCNPPGSNDGMYSYDNFQVATVEMNGARTIRMVLAIVVDTMPVVQ